MTRHLSRFPIYAAAIGLLAISAISAAPSFAAEDAVVIPPPAADVQNASGIQTAVLAGGCFWGVQGVFQHTKGVVSAVSGYAGGNRSEERLPQAARREPGIAELSHGSLP